MKDLDRAMERRRHAGVASRAAWRKPVYDDDLDQTSIPWRGYEECAQDQEWHPVSDEYVMAVLSANDCAIESNVRLMQNGYVMRLGDRRYRWAGEE